jgi:hypothetical protein
VVACPQGRDAHHQDGAWCHRWAAAEAWRRYRTGNGTVRPDRKQSGRLLNTTEALDWALARIEQNASEEPQDQVDACLETLTALRDIESAAYSVLEATMNQSTLLGADNATREDLVGLLREALGYMEADDYPEWWDAAWSTIESIDAALVTAGGPIANPPRHTFWVVSTAHITADDAKLLKADLGPVHYTYEEGFFIPVPDEIELALADMEEQGFSADAIALLHKACEDGIDLLRLDRDADTYTELPSHDW